MTRQENATQQSPADTTNKETRPKTLTHGQKQLLLESEKLLGVPLTYRELECCRWLVFGLPASRIAKKLNISTRTAESHISNLRTKCNCHTKYQLCSFLREKFQVRASVMQ